MFWLDQQVLKRQLLKNKREDYRVTIIIFTQDNLKYCNDNQVRINHVEKIHKMMRYIVHQIRS
jgi:hypothetical protein